MNFNDIFSWTWGQKVDKKVIYPSYKKSTDRKLQTTLDWRQAVIQAEDQYFPYRTMMVNLFQDVVLNGQVIACMDRRRDLTMLRDWEMIKPSGAVDKNAYELINKQWFQKFLHYSLDALFYGYSHIQLGSIVDNEFKNIQITRREYVSPDKKLVLDYPSTPNGVDINDPKYKNWNILVETMNPAGVSCTGYGLLYPVGLCEIYLRNILGMNADYIELYTQPLRIGKTDKTTEEERDFLQQALADFASNGWVLLDKEDTIEFLNANQGVSSSNFEAYTDFEKRLESKIAKIILGHGDAIDSTPGKLGSGQSDDNPVSQALKDKKQMDGMFIEHLVNNELIPRMNALGFNIRSRFQFKNDEEEQEEVLYITDLSAKLNLGGLQLDPEYYMEKTKIPVTLVSESKPEKEDAGEVDKHAENQPKDPSLTKIKSTKK